MIRYSLVLLMTALKISFCEASVGFPASLFFHEERILSVALSPNGHKVAILRKEGESQSIQLLNTVTQTKKNLINLEELSNKNPETQNITWIDNNHIGVQIQETKNGIENLKDTKKNYRFFIISSTNTDIKEVRTKGWLISPERNKPNEFYYAKSGVNSKIYRIEVDKLNTNTGKLSKLSKVDGGQFIKSNEVSSINGYATRWFLDGETPRAVLHYDRDSNLNLTLLKEDNNETVKTWREEVKDDEKHLIPIAISENPDEFYCLDLNEEQEKTVYKVNFNENKVEEVYKSPDYQIINIILSETTNNMIGVKVIKNGGIENIYINKSKDKSKPYFSSLIDSNLKGDTHIQYVEHHNNPGAFYFYRKDKKTTFIGSTNNKLHKRLKTHLIEGKITHQGLEIPYLLSLPNRNNQKHPLLVMPHGGPYDVYDDRYYDPTTQFFTANGFAVLRVNFRGSGGYTTEFLEAGKKQFGHLLLEDIYQTTFHILSRPDINNAKVCALGFSYGGYASTMLLINHPEMFNCAANISGISDVNLFLSKLYRNDMSIKWSQEYIGNIETEFDDLQAISPAYHTQKITKPYFIAHGTEDNIVDIEHAYRLKHALDKNQIKYDWLELEGENHHFQNTEKRIILFDKLLEFLKKNNHK